MNTVFWILIIAMFFCKPGRQILGAVALVIVTLGLGWFALMAVAS